MFARVMAAAAVMLSFAAVAPAAPVPGNANFETPDLGNSSTSYQYAPSGATWTFVNGAGIAASGSDFNVVNPVGGGDQVGFLQGAASQISQLLPFTPGIYTLTFDAEGRDFGGGSNPFGVTVNGIPLTFNSGAFSTITPGTGSFASFTSDPFTVLGPATLSFNGIGASGDVSSFIDNVSLAQVGTVPEPATMAVIGFASLAGLGYARRRKVVA